jgi:hypothetical protein
VSDTFNREGLIFHCNDKIEDAQLKTGSNLIWNIYLYYPQRERERERERERDAMKWYYIIYPFM